MEQEEKMFITLQEYIAITPSDQLKKEFEEVKKHWPDADQPQQSPVKTLQECKDELAKEYGHTGWAGVKNKFRIDSLDVSGLIAFCDEANKRFYNQPLPVTEGREWISVKDRLPESDQRVLTISCWQNHNQPIVYDIDICNYVIDRIFGDKKGKYCFMDEQDEQPGHRFPSHWMPLPSPPKH